MKQLYDIIVIGGGPGGFTAALYAARAGLQVIVLEKLSAGGQMALTSKIDNYPGFPDGVDGFALGESMEQQAQRYGAETELTEVLRTDLSGPVKTVETPEGTYRGRSVIFATGAGHKPLGLPGEQTFAGRGIHYCAACDGMLYRNKTVVVVGGGNSAAADALALSRIAGKVILVHRRDTLRATKIYHEPLKNAPNVEFIWNAVVTGLEGDARLTGITVQDVYTGQTARIPCDGVFISIGRSPASALAAGQLELDAAGYIVADESTQTSLPGVFAVGDVRTKALRQVVTAVADGAVAAHHAELFLAENNFSMQ